MKTNIEIDIDKEVKALEKKRDSELKKITSKYNAKIRTVTADYRKDDFDDDYAMKFDLKKKSVVANDYGFAHNCKPCNKWSKKSDWLIVEIEDYDVFTTFTDCAYGEDDRSAMFRIIKKYEVCPKCGRMIHISTKKFESGESKTRYEDTPSGFDIRPLGWRPKFKIIKG